mmetsp:Transcript_71498/g.170983  ORF Transcript_71498/g.170983 Transcript_71498/m.170983 type:complete len:249 (-) Transcript_71498:1332-2078(-)
MVGMRGGTPHPHLEMHPVLLLRSTDVLHALQQPRGPVVRNLRCSLHGLLGIRHRCVVVIEYRRQACSSEGVHRIVQCHHLVARLGMTKGLDESTGRHIEVAHGHAHPPGRAPLPLASTLYHHHIAGRVTHNIVSEAPLVVGELIADVHPVRSCFSNLRVLTKCIGRLVCRRRTNVGLEVNLWGLLPDDHLIHCAEHLISQATYVLGNLFTNAREQVWAEQRTHVTWVVYCNHRIPRSGDSKRPFKCQE